MHARGVSTLPCVLVLLLAAVILLPAIPALGQETTGNLEGRLLTEEGKPVPAATIVVTSPALQGKRGAISNAQGVFVIFALPVGQYTVKVSHVAYKEQVFEKVRVRLGQTSTVGEVKLATQVYLMEAVVVSGEAPLINPASTEMGGTLDAEEYAALPIERDYRSMASLLPQVNVSYLGDPVNFAGATGLENRYFVDGIDVSDSFEGKEGTRLPYNFVQEVQVKTGAYEAEYRSSLGGTVNAVTYSGSNEVAGQVFGFFTSNAFAGTPHSVPGSGTRGDFAVYDAGFGVGGPIRKDKLWYYAAYNPARQQEDIEILGWGICEDRTTTHSFAGKLTWRADDRTSFVLTAIGDPSRGISVAPPSVTPLNPDPFLAETRRGGVNVVLGGRRIVRDDLLIEASVSSLWRDEVTRAATQIGRDEIAFVDSLNVASGGRMLTEDTRSSVTLARVSGTWFQGRHQVKAGLEYKDVALDFDIHARQLDLWSGGIYDLLDMGFVGSVGNRMPSVFLQDSWRATDRLRINAGLRWDGQFLISSEGKVAQPILDQWQPRVGFTYQPGSLGTHKLFGSFGRFYQELATAGVFWYYNANSWWHEYHFDHDPRLDTAGADTVEYSGGTIQARMDMEGQYFDELTLGYERRIGQHAKAGLRGIYRTLRQGVEDGGGPSGFAFGNPGRGAMRDLPPMQRDYTALEASYQDQYGERFWVFASYVLSRTYGNYEGLFDSQFDNPWVNATSLFDTPEIVWSNATGLLPQDRTHVFKLVGSYDAGAGLNLGFFGFWGSGTPVSEWGTSPVDGWRIIFLRERGTVGRTPAIWDLNLRLGYQLPVSSAARWRPRLTVDFQHVASRRLPVDYDQMHYLGVDNGGHQTTPNPHYNQPTAWQAPMAVRVGVEWFF